MLGFVQPMMAVDAPKDDDVVVYLGTGFWPGDEPMFKLGVTVPSNIDVVRLLDIQGGPPVCDLWKGSWSAPPFALSLSRDDKSYNLLHIDRDGKLTSMETVPGGRLKDGDWFHLLSGGYGHVFAEERNESIANYIRRFERATSIPEIVAKEALLDLEISTTSSAGDSSSPEKFRMLSNDKQSRRWLFALKRDAAFMEARNRTRVRFHVAGTPVSIAQKDGTRQTFSIVFSTSGRTLRSGSVTFSYLNSADLSKIRGSVRIESAFVSTMPVDIYIENSQ